MSCKPTRSELTVTAMSNLMTPTVAWLLLLAASALEIVWAASMKASAGFTKAVPTIVTIVAAWASFGLLGLSVKVLPVGTAYAVWTGIGALGVAVIGIACFGEPATLARLTCMALIILGAAGLRWTHVPA